jgi:tetratricopeptide (TPR) repeat protein
LSKLRFASRNYPEDLWRSADNYMKGHDFTRAVAYYKKFLDTQGRPARPPALTAIGQAMLALNKPAEALPWLEECIEFFPRDPHSYRARIIAAQAHRELSNPEQAKRLLQANLEHDALTPRALEWRESLFALGDLHFLEGMLLETQSRLDGVNSDSGEARKVGLKKLELAQASFREAIRRLSEAVQRVPDAPQAIEARYQIAESHRHAAKLPRKRLPTVTIDTTRKRLNAEINRELAAAEAGYGDLLERLNGLQDQGELSDIELRVLRNCYFARADALYDMARYDEAIQAYSTATNRYQHEPESLEAYVQIANCHRRKDRYAEARGTLEQAKVVLSRIRSEADFTQTTRYDRKQWAELLDWLATL